VVGRTTLDGDTEVLLVHRPKYDDWSLPKGKRDPAETDEQCAVREVEEETGLRCHLGRELLPTMYTDPKGRPKIVRYWSMTVVGERPFVPGNEIDGVRWLEVADALGLLSYDRDAEVVRSFAIPRMREL
jgi:8-oxo-dGTP pyrophosphatase MutT (NUDIX family)